MDNSINTPSNHTIGTILTIFSFVFGWITQSGVETFIRILSGTASIVAAVMGIRYYYYATKKKILP